MQAVLYTFFFQFFITHLNTLFNNICVDASDEDLEKLHFSNIDE